MKEWEYKILKSDLWYSIYRKKEMGKLMMLQYLNWDGKWVMSRDSARVFYNENDVASALVVAKCKWETEEIWEDKSESIPEEKVEKQSRSEF